MSDLIVIICSPLTKWFPFFGAVTPPAQRVQFILGEDQDGDSGHEPHPLFSEMEELCLDEDGEMEWKETARWVKFEEDVEVKRQR